MERLLILDGNSLMNRAFYAIPALNNSEGLNTNAIYGFINMLFKMREELKPNYIVTTFDKKAPTFRHKDYKDYKAGRKKMPPELSEQFPVVKELLEKLAINIFEIEGFEADDLIGTLASFSRNQGIEVYIVTGDKDALQLAEDNVKIVINKKGMTEKEIYDKDRMLMDYGVTPKQFIDVKGLMGDSSDNIPGVPGIGEKTALKLIKEYGSIENVLMNIDNLSGKKIKENLKEYREQAVFSKKLATIVTDVPIEIDLEDIKSKEKFDVEAVRKMFVKLEFKSLMNKIPVSSKEDGQESLEDIKVEYKLIDTIEKLKEAANSIKDILYILFENEDEQIYSKSSIKKIYLNTGDRNYIIDYAEIFNSDSEELIGVLKKIFEDENIEKVIHDSKIPYTILAKINVSLKGLIFDTKIAAYLIDPAQSEYGLNGLIRDNLNIDIKDEDELLRVKEIQYLKPIYEDLSEKIKLLNMEELFYNVEKPLIEVLSSMEARGFKIDKLKLNELGEKFSEKIQETKEEIYSLSGEEFNISSPKQLGKILFEKLDLPVIKKTKTGYSTNAEVLEKLRDKHPIIDNITYYRQLTKLYSTYVEGLKTVIDSDDRIHSSFNQTVTTTGRLSSTEPNLQNIPIKHEMGREIRKVFIPDDSECVILSGDYSQIELRVLAHIANDENLINAFKHHSDIHTKTASEVFNVPIDQVTPLMRSNAKAVNFGIVYGIGDFSLAQDLKIPKSKAKEYIDTYFERYPNVKKYLEDIVIKAKEDLYVTTILNRRRYIPEIKARNKMVASFGERLAMNTPIQGSAADIIKLAMVKVYNKLKEENLKSTIILQVHDELILNVYKDEIEVVKKLVKEEMENAIELKVPLEVDINIGETWYEAK
ncbi:DNA polymerase I [Clostridium pasteurianum]|nr:DNA polymerase I [Clostridium pasteurianum]AOZ77358.1 DNA polymerase I [Clostridium pasteurianum DSM 525 = ATCC 6013]AOZ81155.1 DNA polymerase I [Clostridium pasteurianum]ELP57986.1 DNA polymerase I [Clostridium pasteurianum DSM 525 = ATCC 6013]OMH22068.1 DNA polymerase I [Clostridium pasteurianum]UZW16308.1 DNA polymerase I [Clostridium pasteurianum]